MKNIIDGKTYDTETATALGSAKLPGFELNADSATDPASKFDRAGTSTLYQTTEGAYFLVRRVKPEATANPDLIRDEFAISEPGLFPLSREDARSWARFWKFGAIKIEVMFGNAE